MKIWLVCIALISLTACGISKATYNVNKKISRERVLKDYDIFQEMVEESHPGLYWFYPKSHIDSAFEKGRASVKDSMNATEFRRVLSRVYANVGCGHSTISSPKQKRKRPDSTDMKLFPFSLKIWPTGTPFENDTAVVTYSLFKNDSIFTRGTVIKKINSRPISEIADTIFQYLSTDGYNLTHKYQTISNGLTFSRFYSALFGKHNKYLIEYIDSAGKTVSDSVAVFEPLKDSSFRKKDSLKIKKPKVKKTKRKTIIENERRLTIDSATAYMMVSTFASKYKLKPFFRKSFRTLRKKNIKNLVIDVRGNGGGVVTNSTLLTRYIANKPFKIADSLYALTKKTKYSRYVEKEFMDRMFMLFFTKKMRDGKYHFRYYEKHIFKPKQKNHYNGNTYIITGGNSFSATTLFAGMVREQDNVTLAGEETGGSAYGNTAWLIPDIILPNTGVRFRLPMFRLVIDKNAVKTGKGVQPEIIVTPSADAIKKGIDYKMEKVKELIKSGGLN